MELLLVVNNIEDFPAQVGEASVITAKSYLTDPSYIKTKEAMVFNLCRSYKYQSQGYYVSLLAEARGHKVYPTITTIQDTKTTAIVRIKSSEIEEVIQRTLGQQELQEVEFNIYFGKALNPQYQELAMELFYLFPSPWLQASFYKENKEWHLHHLSLLSLKEIQASEKEFAINTTEDYLNNKQFSSKKAPSYSYEIAILVNPDDPEPPSGPQAIKRFIKAALSLGMRAWTISKEDYNSIGEYDGLFIRETTNVNHHTYRFARRAAVERIAVMDDPESILRCSNKVYQAELLNLHNIRTPKTMVISKESSGDLLQHFSFPIILKSPDSAFSKGVVKVKDEVELKKETERMFGRSELLIAQEFLPSSYDWRIGVLDQKPLFACKYFMATDHWQIINQQESDENKWGGTETIDVNEVPEAVIKTALSAANLIGKGLYGVDIKEIGEVCYVIEINDNPNIDEGFEDKVLGDELYLKVMRLYLERIKELKFHKEV